MAHLKTNFGLSWCRTLNTHFLKGFFCFATGMFKTQCVFRCTLFRLSSTDVRI